MDIDAGRLGLAEKVAQRLNREFGAELRFRSTLDREEALRGCDFVVNSAQVGGHAWTEAQRELAQKHGYYRGARLHDFGQILLMLEVARDVERICPEAWILQIANPVFEGCTVMHRMTGAKVVGLCHGPNGYRHVADVLGLDLERVTARTHGFNHWIWLTDFRYDGEDAYPLLDEWIRDGRAEAYWKERYDRDYKDVQMSRGAIHQYQLYGMLPIGDTPRIAGWWYNTDLETKRHWYNASGGFDSEVGWGKYLEVLEEKLAKFDAAVLDEEVPLTEATGTRMSQELVVPIIDAMTHDTPLIGQVNIPNTGGLVRGFPEDLVIECEAVVSAAGIRGTQCPELPPKLFHSAMVPRWTQAELVCQAVQERDRDLVLHALLNHRWTGSLGQAERLLADWFAEDRNRAVAEYFRVR